MLDFLYVSIYHLNKCVSWLHNLLLRLQSDVCFFRFGLCSYEK